MLRQPLVTRRCHEECGEASTLEREYIHVLVLQLLYGGHLSPYEAFWLNRQIPRWCAVLSLQPGRAGAVVDRADHRLVVDPDSAAGLAWPSGPRSGAQRHLDPAPMLALIRDEIARLSDPAGSADRSSPLRRGRQLKLLGAVSANCVPRPAPIHRRGERLPLALTVEAVVGLAPIARMLHHEMRTKSAIAPPAVHEVEAGPGTVTGAGAVVAPGARPDGGQRAVRTTGEFDVRDQVWQLKDRSASGSRLRGRIADSSRVLPGALVAFREHGNTAWTLAVVRRVRKRIGDRIDIGVEYVGQNALAVNLAVDGDRAGPSNDAPPDRKRKRCMALLLRESVRHPHMPFKTLILSPREFRAGRRLSLRSDGAEYTIRLKEPIEEQDGFVWLPYEIVFRTATDGPAAAAGLELPGALRRAGSAGKT
jgi:hypothetical protein